MYLDNLAKNSEEISKSFNGDFVEINKKMSRLMKQARDNAKGDTCFYCGKRVGSFCNSHNIPAFCLRNIEQNGKVLNANSIIQFPFLFKEEQGVGDAGTFHIICNECDNTIFQDYEDPNAYERALSHKILAAIALKCSLKFIYKRKVETELYKLMGDIKYSEEYLETNSVNSLDLVDYLNDYKKAKKYLKSNDADGYYLIDYMLLDYVTPITFQAPIALYVDFDGNIVNDIYNKDANYHMKDLYVCVFPLKAKTVIILFIDNNEKRYRKFYKKYRSMSQIEKLSVINYLIFLYSEDFYLSSMVKDEIQKNETIKTLTGKTSRAFMSEWDLYNTDVYGNIKMEYDLNKHSDIPNFLSKEYGIATEGAV